MITRRRFLITWIGGLIAFAVTIWFHLPLIIDAIPEGITAHQRAGTAERVNEVQTAWSAAGVYRDALTAMLTDLAFIAVYALGSLIGGLYFLRVGTGSLRTLGSLLVFAALVFGAVDFTETILQVQQLTAGQGDDAKAGLAAAMYWPKNASFIVCFILPLIGLWLELRSA